MTANRKFGWSEQLCTGNDIIDEQHKELISLIFRLTDDLSEGNTKSVGTTIDYLQDYVIEHFGAEEKLMIRTSYPGFEKHRDEHTAYVKTVYRLKIRNEHEGITPGLVCEVEQCIADWLVEHINSTDMELVQYLNAQTPSC